MCRNMKFFVLVLVTIFFSNYVYSKDDKYDSFPIFELKDSEKNPSEKEITLKEYACPAPPLMDLNIDIDTSDTKKPKSKLDYCIFSKPVTPETDTKCETEVKPIFTPSQIIQNEGTRELKKCGSLDTHYIFSFGFYHCGNEERLKEFRKKQLENDLVNLTQENMIMEVYEVCYDTAIDEAVWTRHRIQTVPLFDKMSGNDEDYTKTEIGVDPFLLEQPPFERIKQIYEAESQRIVSQDNWKMYPQPLVPAEHIAINVWKKATNHIINIFPLWTKLVPLMSAIHTGLKKAQMNLYISNPNSFPILEILTRVARPSLSNAPNDRLSPDQFLQPNIWYILIYEETNMKAILITIHNTPHNPPLPNNCFQRVVCEFQRWTSDEKVRNAITESDLQYAYCCQVSSQQVKAKFFKDIKIKGTLNINNLIIGGNKHKARDSPNMASQRSRTKFRKLSELSNICSEENPFKNP